MGKFLYGNQIEKACKYCSVGKGVMSDGKVHCKKGIKNPDHHCFSFSYDPLLRKPKEKLQFTKLSKSDFEL